MWVSTDRDHREVGSADELQAVLGRLGADRLFVIIRTEPPPDGAQCSVGPSRFAQASVFVSDDGSINRDRFVVEYHEPDGSHFQAETCSVKDAVDVLCGWAFGPAGWERLLPFAPLRLP